eukprot:jgi/Botrbrau1/18069/Bobra.0062s0055.1
MDTRNSMSGFVFMLNGRAAFLVKHVTAVGWDIDGRSPVHCCESCVVEIYQAQKCVLSSGLGESSMGSNIAGIREDGRECGRSVQKKKKKKKKKKKLNSPFFLKHRDSLKKGMV